jgi:hypothetical protein
MANVAMASGSRNASGQKTPQLSMAPIVAFCVGITAGGRSTSSPAKVLFKRNFGVINLYL